tara:strand:- start:2494 stop:3105 length:612 start_codon:yes stop_codon:yes gene_type:complete
VEGGAVAIGEGGAGGGGCQAPGAGGQGRGRAIAPEGPGPSGGALFEEGGAIDGEEGAIGEAGGRDGFAGCLALQDGLDFTGDAGVEVTDADGGGEAGGIAEGLGGVAAAFETRAMACGEGGRLVEEEELGIETGLHEGTFAALEFKLADDPLARCPVARFQRLVRPVEAATAIAHEGAARGIDMELAERVDAVLERHGVLQFF